MAGSFLNRLQNNKAYNGNVRYLFVSFTTIYMLLCVPYEDALGKDGESCADECRSPERLCSTSNGESIAGSSGSGA